jgi:predicted MFS family arabinose efflux permease
VVGCLAALALAFAVLASLAFSAGHTATTVVVGLGALMLWGAMATSLPPMLQSVAMRTAPGDPDGASGLYVAAFQVGIMAGSLAGGLLYERSGVPVILAASAVLVASVLAGVTAIRHLFDVPGAISQK